MTPEIERLNAKILGDVRWSPSLSNNSNRSHGDFCWQDIAFNINSFPCETDTAIIVTSWPGQLRWLKSTLRSYRDSGKYVILSYDNPFFTVDPNSLREESIWSYMPRPCHFLLAHSVVFKHKTYDADKRTGWFWDVRYAQGIIKQFPNIKYVYCTNGDCIWEKPKGIDDLIKYMGDADFMSGQSEPARTIHTADILFRVEAFHAVMDNIAERMKVPILGSRSAEGLLRLAVDQLKLREKFAEQPLIPEDGSIDYYATRGLPSTFKEIVGFRNLYAEQEYRENNGLEPLPKEHFDSFNNWSYMPGSDRETLCRYYDTGDRRYLLQWFDRGEDYWGNRLYYPLEHYTSDPRL